MTTNSSTRLLGLALLAGVAGALMACAAVHVDVDRAERAGAESAIANAREYAWPHPPELTEAAAGEDGDDLTERIRMEVDSRLAAMGLRRVPGGKPDVHVAAHLDVAVRERVADPYFAHFDRRRYEEAVLTLEVSDRLTGAVLWSGVARRRLRFTANEVGLFSSRYVEIDEPRDWGIEDMVAAVTDRLRSARR